MAVDVWHWNEPWIDDENATSTTPSLPSSPLPPPPVPAAPLIITSATPPPPSVPAPAPSIALQPLPVAPPSVLPPPLAPEPPLGPAALDASELIKCVAQVKSMLERNTPMPTTVLAVLHRGGRAALNELQSYLLSNDQALALFADQYLQLTGPPEIQSVHSAVLFIELLLLPRLIALQTASSRVLLQLLLAVGRGFPRPMAEALVAPLAALPPSAVQLELLVRLATDVLTPQMLSSSLEAALSTPQIWSTERAPDVTARLLALVPPPAPDSLLVLVLSKAESAAPSLSHSHRFAHLLKLLAKSYISAAQPSMSTRLVALLSRSNSYVARSAEVLLQAKSK